MFFRNRGPVPRTLRTLSRSLKKAGMPHIFIGAAALKAYGLRRSTEDVDVCMRREDLERFKAAFVGTAYLPVKGRPRRFFDSKTQVTVDVLIAGEIAGKREKQQSVRFPDPDEGKVIEGIPIPDLARLVELKLVTWRLQDWADVVVLIRENKLDESFADQLDPVVRTAYLQCHDDMLEEDRYNPEIDD
ncbi:MAG TPA: hypothetical protein PKC49_05175 [Phycisphaerae bacterium]|nr:hypothetical protein [Phycisphaerae bacterium]